MTLATNCISYSSTSRQKTSIYSLSICSEVMLVSTLIKKIRIKSLKICQSKKNQYTQKEIYLSSK